MSPENSLRLIPDPWHVEAHELHITGSIGISIFPEDGEDVDSLLNHADIAMYQIKGTGRNGYVRYHAGMTNGRAHPVD